MPKKSKKMPWWERPIEVGDAMFWGTQLKSYGENSHFHWRPVPESITDDVGPGTVIVVTKVCGDVRLQLAG